MTAEIFERTWMNLSDPLIHVDTSLISKCAIEGKLFKANSQ